MNVTLWFSQQVLEDGSLNPHLKESVWQIVLAGDDKPQIACESWAICV